MAEEDTTVLDTNQQEGEGAEQVNDTPDPGWISAVKKEIVEAHGEDMRQHSNINPILEDYYSIKAKNAEAIFRPKEGATSEEIAQYNELMGIPADAQGYEFETPPEGIGNADFDTWFRDVSLENKLDTGQAKGVHNAWNKLQKEAADAKKAETTEAERVARAELGSGYDAAVANAVKILEIGGEELKSWLDETGAGNDPRFLKVFTKIGSLISEDSIGSTHSKPGGERLSVEERLYPNQGK